MFVLVHRRGMNLLAGFLLCKFREEVVHTHISTSCEVACLCHTPAPLSLTHSLTHTNTKRSLMTKKEKPLTTTLQPLVRATHVSIYAYIQQKKRQIQLYTNTSKHKFTHTNSCTRTDSVPVSTAYPRAHPGVLDLGVLERTHRSRVLRGLHAGMSRACTHGPSF